MMHENATPRRPEAGVKAADSALSILEAVALAREPIGLTQIARQLALSKAGVFRYLRTLTDRGYVVQSRDSGRYRLGPKALAIGHLAPIEGNLIDASEMPMRSLVAASGLTTVLAAPSPEGVIIMRSMSGSRGRALQVWPGQILRPFHALAHGKLCLAFGPPEYRQRTFARPLDSRTAKTITDHERLRQELERVERLGYAVACEELVAGVGVLAAPIFAPGHELRRIDRSRLLRRGHSGRSGSRADPPGGGQRRCGHRPSAPGRRRHASGIMNTAGDGSPGEHAPLERQRRLKRRLAASLAGFFRHPTEVFPAQRVKGRSVPRFIRLLRGESQYGTVSNCRIAA